MTTYRIYGRPVVDGPTGDIQLGLLVGKNSKVQYVTVDTAQAWAISEGLLAALRDGHGR